MSKVVKNMSVEICAEGVWCGATCPFFGFDLRDEGLVPRCSLFKVDNLSVSNDNNVSEYFFHIRCDKCVQTFGLSDGEDIEQVVCDLGDDFDYKRLDKDSLVGKIEPITENIEFQLLSPDIDPITSDDGFWYNLTLGGYIDPDKILIPENAMMVNHAVKVLQEFEAFLVYEGLLEDEDDDEYDEDDDFLDAIEDDETE